MNKEFETYVTNRVHELSNAKRKLFASLQTINKPVNELDAAEQKDILGMRMEYYLITGALAELEELRSNFKI